MEFHKSKNLWSILYEIHWCVIWTHASIEKIRSEHLFTALYHTSDLNWNLEIMQTHIKYSYKEHSLLNIKLKKKIYKSFFFILIFEWNLFFCIFQFNWVLITYMWGNKMYISIFKSNCSEGDKHFLHNHMVWTKMNSNDSNGFY